MEEGLYFEVKPKREEARRQRSSEKPRSNLTSNHRSCPSFSHLTSSTQSQQKYSHGRRTATWGENEEDEDEEEVRYTLTLTGSLPVHHLTTMAMLPWVVAEIRRSCPAGKEPLAGSRREAHISGQFDPSTSNRTVFLCVTALWVRCVSFVGPGLVWDPLTHTVLFECRPHQVTKLIHNSQEPSSFACLVKDFPSCGCYVFQCQDSTKVGACKCVCK